MNKEPMSYLPNATINALWNFLKTEYRLTIHLYIMTLEKYAILMEKKADMEDRKKFSYPIFLNQSPSALIIPQDIINTLAKSMGLGDFKKAYNAIILHEIGRYLHFEKCTAAELRDIYAKQDSYLAHHCGDILDKDYWKKFYASPLEKEIGKFAGKQRDLLKYAKIIHTLLG